MPQAPSLPVLKEASCLLSPISVDIPKSPTTSRLSPLLPSTGSSYSLQSSQPHPRPDRVESLEDEVTNAIFKRVKLTIADAESEITATPSTVKGMMGSIWLQRIEEQYGRVNCSKHCN